MPKLRKSPLFPDVNVWLALTYAGHIHHDIARAWYKTLDLDDSIHFCRITQIGLLRLLTTRAVMAGDVMTQDAAWVAYDKWMSDGRISVLDEPANVEPSFRALCHGSDPHPKIWTDAYLAAFAIASGMQLVTFDWGFWGKVPQLMLLGR
jgi:toxin-antitoxin system PIN domain toxin